MGKKGIVDPRLRNKKRVWTPNPGSQVLALSCPIRELLIEGTRGNGKTDVLLMDYAQHVGQGFGEYWRGVLFRETYKQLADIVARSKRWFRQAFPEARFLSSLSDFKWVWPDGEELLLRQMRRTDDYWDYHGHEYPWIGWEELTNWTTLDCYDTMKACNRSSNPDPRMPRKYRATCNPWGRGHNAVKARFIDPAPAGVVIRDDDGWDRVRLHGHFSENKALLAADPNYAKTIASAAGSNEERRKAWLLGSWDIVAGGMFDDVVDRKIHFIKPFPIPKSWIIDRSFDWGSAKPFSCGWWAESDGTEAPNGVTYPRGTIFRIHEWYGCAKDDKGVIKPNEGLKLPRAEITKGILGIQGSHWLLKDRRVLPGPADLPKVDDSDSVSMAEDMKKAGLEWTEPDKRPGSRKARWEKMREMFAAGLRQPMEEPGLFIFDTCTDGFIRTVPVLSRSDDDPDDIDSDAEDHAADESGYRVLHKRKRGRVIPTAW